MKIQCDKTINRYEFDVYLDTDHGGWFWVVYKNNEIVKISEPFHTEEAAEEDLAKIHCDILVNRKFLNEI